MRSFKMLFTMLLCFFTLALHTTTAMRIFGSSAAATPSYIASPIPAFDVTRPPDKMNNRIQCVKLLARETSIMSLSTDGVRLIYELHNAINDLFRFYHGKGRNACPLTTTTTPPPTAATEYPDSAQVALNPTKGCETDKLINLIERRLLELVAKGPSRETLRILASRLLEVVQLKKEYEEAADCVDDPGEALKSILADFDRVQGLLRYEF